MIRKEEIEKKLENFFVTRPDLFVVEVNVTPENDIYIYLDGDKGVSIDDCVAVSTYLQNQLPAEENFSLQVSSWGIETPLKLHRQYVKNIGKQVRVLMNDGTRYEGQLVAVKDSYFIIEMVRGMKVKVAEKKDIPFDACKKVQVKIAFEKKL
jgi:ribosome maturation factor RimP